MKTLRIILLFAFLLPFSFQASAQISEKADKLTNRLDYQGAIPLYLFEYNRTGEIELLAKLANAYLETRRYDSAYYYYRRLFSTRQIQDSAVLVNYARTQVAMGNLGGAESSVRIYRTARPNREGMETVVQNIAMDKEVEDNRNRFSIKNVAGLNTALDEFSPLLVGENIIFCGQEAGKTSKFDGRPFVNLLEARKDISGNYKKPNSLPGNITTNNHEGPATLSNGTLYFTRNIPTKSQTGRYYGGERILQMYTATLTPKGWGKVKSFQWNNSRYSIGHPTISPSGQYLVFTSGQRQAVSGTDLFYCVREGDKWSRPRPLENVNSDGNEMFPYFRDDKTLFFASNGHPGLGGLDIFVATFKEGNTSKPKNLGKPFNTVRDDFGIAFNAGSDKSGFFSSDRAGGKGGDDIYEFNGERFNVNIIAINANNNQALEKVRITTPDSVNTELLYTDINGIATIPLNRMDPLPVIASKPGFKTVRVPIKANSLNSDTTVEILMVPGRTQRMAGRITTPEGDPIMARAKMSRLDDGLPMYARTDPYGNYEFDLDPMAEYDLETSADDYFRERRRVKPGDGLDSRMYKMELGKPIVIQNIYYDFDKADLRPLSQMVCDTIVRLMKNNPNVTLEISSHTDVRGTDDYNMELAARRGKAVVDHLVTKGISPDRLSMRVYGAAKNAAPCPPGRQCPEDVHQLNRRTEFRVTGY